MKSISVIALLLTSGAFANAAPAVEKEMDALLASLRGSKCRFERNGTWYDAGAAADHLQKKRQYLDDKEKIAKSEDFVRLGASESSLSGKPYHVQCQDQPIVASKVWLEAELGRLRKASSPH